MTQANLNATDRLSFAKRWAEIANNQFNEATGPQIDDAVFNLSAAEDHLNASLSLIREVYPQQQVRQQLRSMDKIRKTADAWLTAAVVSFVLTCSAVAYLVYRAFKHFQ